MYFSDIIGQDDNKNRIINTIKNNQIAHAQLFIGKNNAPSLAMAIATARYLNCLNPKEYDACGECSSCKKYDIYAHPDLHFLFPIININSQNICDDSLNDWRVFLNKGAYTSFYDWSLMLDAGNKKASIFAREAENLSKKMALRRSEAKKRVLIIWLAEKMNSILANKLLKLTEEPPEDTIIFMISEDEKSVLPTLLSRLQKIYINPLDEHIISKALEDKYGIEENLANIYAHLSNGSMRKAIDLAKGNNEEEQILLTRYKDFMLATASKYPINIKDKTEKMAQLSRDEQVDLIRYLSKMFRENYIYTFDTERINYLSSSEEAFAKYIKGAVNEENIYKIMADFEEAEKHILQNVNSKMIFYDLALRIKSYLNPYYKEMGIER